MDPIGSSRVSGVCVATTEDSENNLLAFRSSFIPAEAMLRYRASIEKLRRDLKDSNLDDHKWELRSYDEDGIGIVKLYCCECWKETGGDSGNHGKIHIQNLFSNFRTNHLHSIQHIKAWCCKYNVNYLNHPQSAASKGKTVLLSPENHRRLM